MRKQHAYCVVLSLALGCPATANAYKNCDRVLGDWMSWDSSYFVGELEFNPDTTDATGSVTYYNYSKFGPDDIRECHITYAFSGSFEPVSALFLLDADRTNQSPSCPDRFVDSQYPAYMSHTLQLLPGNDGAVEVITADNGDAIARGSLLDRSLVYRVDELCLPR